VVRGVDIGARLIYTSGALLLLNLILITVFFKELELATFDPLLAAVLGFSPAVLHYGLMTLVSATAVGAFEAVGSILIVAFMVGPPVTAWLLTDDLKTMLVFSGCFAMLNAVFGYRFAMWLDVSIAGSISVVTGLIFALVQLFAPRRGLLAAAGRRNAHRREFAKITLLMQIRKKPERYDGKALRSTAGTLLREQKTTLRDGEITATQNGLDSIDEFLRKMR